MCKNLLKSDRLEIKTAFPEISNPQAIATRRPKSTDRLPALPAPQRSFPDYFGKSQQDRRSGWQGGAAAPPGWLTRRSALPI